MNEKLVRNRLRCKKCLDIIESKHVHDFVRCKCGSIFVDGGQEYCRYGCPKSPAEDWIEFLTEYDDS